MRKITADCIYTMAGEPLVNGLIELDDENKIINIKKEIESTDIGIERFKGIITPGFVNTHCHLELSHMKGKIKEGQGLFEFIKQIINNRHADDNTIIQAMKEADEQMWKNGIVAVGDISNLAISADTKAKSKIRYHTFVEILGMDPSKSTEILKNAIHLAESFSESVSITPHAGYSVSKQLFKEFKKYCKHHDNLISIHNQENDDENKLFRYKTGQFIDLYKDIGVNIDHFVAMSKNAIQAVLPLLPDNQRILFVHNTFTSLKDIYTVKRFPKDIYWCFCPGANVHIENALPNFYFFEKTNQDCITLGTDSLASNQSLSILDEMKIISKNYTASKLVNLISWATINGARFLGIDSEFGTLETGKSPGINLITHIENNRITQKSEVIKLA